MCLAALCKPSYALALLTMIVAISINVYPVRSDVRCLPIAPMIIGDYPVGGLLDRAAKRAAINALYCSCPSEGWFWDLVGSCTCDKCQELIDADTDQDGLISQDEFKAYASRQQKYGAEGVNQAWERFDINKDGRISPNEFVKGD